MTISRAGLAAAVTLLAVLLVALVVVLAGSDDASPSPTASTSPMPQATSTPVSTPMPTATPIAGSEIDLARAAWWDIEEIGFGIIPEWTPEPDPPLQSAGYRQLRIGTLDGRVTAMLALHWEHGHSHVSLPVDGRVLVADDFGVSSSIRSVDAATGAFRQLFVTDQVVAAVALVPGSDAYVYALADRVTHTGLGIWLSDGRGGAPRRIDEAPDGFGRDLVPEWRLAVSPDGRTLVAQFCRGEVACETHLVELESGASRETDAIGWVDGFLGREVLAYRLRSNALARMDLDTLQFRPAGDFQPGGISDQPGSFAVDLPYGWRADWPELLGMDSIDAGVNPKPVRLVNGFSGEELLTPPLELTWPSGCSPIRPERLPGGQRTGQGVATLEDGVRMVRYGQGDELVAEAMGPLPAPAIVGDAEPVAIRGTDGWLTYDTPGPVPPWIDLLGSVSVIGWEEAGCWYRVRLAPAQMGHAREYAARF